MPTIVRMGPEKNRQHRHATSPWMASQMLCSPISSCQKSSSGAQPHEPHKLSPSHLDVSSSFDAAVTYLGGGT